jgi:TolA-binding protein
MNFRYSIPFGVLLAAGLLGATLAPGVAHAEDDRRVLKARQVTGEDISEEYAKAAEQKRLESIEYLKSLISNNPNLQGDQKAEMLLRLADLYFQEGRYLYLTEMAAFDKEYEACFNKEGCDAEAMVANNTKSREWQDKSIKLYDQILRNYPRYARADEAMYYMSSAMQDVGRKDEANDVFTNLVRQYPDSQWVPDSYVAIGEYWFDKNEAYKALVAYKKATGFRDSSMYGFANYKLAWCYYNVGEYGNAIDTMKAVVALAAEQAASTTGGAQTSKLQLQDEALKDLVRFFADAGELDAAYEYFTKLGKKELIRDMLKRLAGTYYEQGKFEQCVETYRRLINDTPTAADNVDYQVEIIKAYKKIGRPEDTLAEIDRLLKTYGKDSAWQKSNASNPEAIKGANEAIELNLRQVAVEAHQKAKQLGTGDEAKQQYAIAYKAYKTYLDNYPTGEHTYEVRYAYAELLYKIKHYDEAYEQYMAVVKIDPKAEKSEFCAESAIFAADEMIKQEAKTNPQSAPPPGDHTPQPLTQWEQNLIAACAQYGQLYPDSKKNLNVMYKSAYLLYNKFHFAEAADQFAVVIKMQPGSKEAEQAAHLILDSFKVNEDWENLKKNAKFYYDQPGLGSTAFKAEVYDIYERASFKLIEVTLTKDNDKGKAADGFIAFYQEFPKSQVAAQALNNASVYYHDTSRVGDEIKTRLILVEDPAFGPKTKYYYDQVGALGFDYDTIGAFDKAGAYYEKLFSLYPKQLETVKKESPDKVDALTQQASDALYSAAVFQRATGKWDLAIQDYTKFTTSFPTDKRVDDVKLTIGKTWEDQKKWPEAANVYYAYYTKATKETPAEYTYFARLHYAKALEAQGQKGKADDVYKETVALYKKQVAQGMQPGAQTEFVAEMLYILAEPKFQEYMALKIQGAGGSSRKAEDTAIEKSLKAKVASLAQIEKTYTEIIGTGAGEWGLASLVKLGQVYENMGETLKGSTVPYYLDDDQKEMYRMQLEDKVYPQVEKAVAAYSAALGKSYELTLYNDDTAFATRRLGVLRPDDFPGLTETLLEPRYTSSVSHKYDFETGL